MSNPEQQIQDILDTKEASVIQIYTMGTFSVERNGASISTKEWGRDKTVQLFQYLVTTRHLHAAHKEQIIDRLWEDVDQKSGGANFKVALHGINKALEPDRTSRSQAKYIDRQGLTYRLMKDGVWIDSDVLEKLISLGNQFYGSHPAQAEEAYRNALQLYKGSYLPNRVYADWSAEERERLQVLSLGAYISLAELLLQKQPMESVRLTQQALQIDPTWEDAYRIQMEAYYTKGNRPMAIKTYNKCVEVLEQEFGIEPLPITKKLLAKING